MSASSRRSTRARGYTDDVEWSARWTRRAPSTIISAAVVEAAIKAGATTINIPDTVGYTMPEEYLRTHRDAARARAGRRTGSSSRPIATTIWVWRSPTRSPASQAGARQIECTINGIGERAGNAALEEIVMAIRTRNDVLPY